MKDMLELYGKQGTSSDESDIEDGLTIYRVKTLPWRRDVRKVLENVDARRYTGGVYSNRGAKPRLRTRRGYIESERGRVSGLPLSLYDEKWLMAGGDLQDHVLAEASTGKFPVRRVLL